MFFPEGTSTLQQMSLTWHCLKGLLKVMQLITGAVITALLLRYLKWFIIDSLMLECAEHLHTHPWTLRQGPVQAPQTRSILSPAEAAAPCGTQHRALCHHSWKTWPAAGTVASPGCLEYWILYQLRVWESNIHCSWVGPMPVVEHNKKGAAGMNCSTLTTSPVPSALLKALTAPNLWW